MAEVNSAAHAMQHDRQSVIWSILFFLIPIHPFPLFQNLERVLQDVVLDFKCSMDKKIAEYQQEVENMVNITFDVTSPYMV